MRAFMCLLSATPSVREGKTRAHFHILHLNAEMEGKCVEWDGLRGKIKREERRGE